MKYSILIPYLDRAAQFRRTLVSFLPYAERSDWEILLIEDEKNRRQDRTHNELLQLLVASRKQNVRITVCPGGDPTNPSPHYNLGARSAHGDYLILTSPEVRHVANILEGLDTSVADDAYVVCACRAENGKWWQHSVRRPANYHFCTAISRLRYLDVGGFDEAYASGYAFDDDDWLNTVRAAGLRVVPRDDLVTVHQKHGKPWRPSHWRVLWERNRRLYVSKWGPYIEPPVPT